MVSQRGNLCPFLLIVQRHVKSTSHWRAVLINVPGARRGGKVRAILATKDAGQTAAIGQARRIVIIKTGCISVSCDVDLHNLLHSDDIETGIRLAKSVSFQRETLASINEESVTGHHGNSCLNAYEILLVYLREQDFNSACKWSSAVCDSLSTDALNDQMAFLLLELRSSLVVFSTSHRIPLTSDELGVTGKLLACAVDGNAERCIRAEATLLPRMCTKDGV